MNRRDAIRAAIGGVAAACGLKAVRRPMSISLPRGFYAQITSVEYAGMLNQGAMSRNEVRSLEALGALTWEYGDYQMQLPDGSTWRSIRCTGYAKNGVHHELPCDELFEHTSRANRRSIKRALERCC